jgi:simple sugar transport system substrate-binding protein
MKTILRALAIWPALLTLQVRSSSAAEPPHFVFITTCADEAFFKAVRRGMEDAAKAMGVSAEFTGTHGVDIKAQAAMVREAVKAGCDGIALNIIDPVGFDEVIKEARDRGVPVVAFNIDDKNTPNARLSGISQNFQAAGRKLGTHALEFIPAGSHILMTLHDEGISALDERLASAQSVLRERGITWDVVVTGHVPEDAAKAVAAKLRKNPKIRHILCTGQADTEGTGLAIERDFPDQGHVVAGFDLSPDILRLIQKGVIKFTIDQQPYSQGFYPVVQLALYKRHGIMPADVDAGASMIDRDNVERVMKLSEAGYR